MAGQVVQDDHIPLAPCRRELGFDIGVESRTVHGAVNDPRRIQPVVAQRRNEGLSTPMAEGSMNDEPLPARCPACRPGHVGLQPSLIRKPDAVQHMRHKGLAMRDPDMPLAGNPGTLLLKRLNVFVCVSARAVERAAKRNRDRQTRRGCR